VSKTRNLSDLLDANGDVKSGALDNVPASDVVNDTSPQLGGDLASNGNDILMADNDKIKVGTGNDLEIYHDGSASYLKDTGSGVLFMQTNGLRLRTTTDESMIDTDENGSVALYHDNSKKLETASGGVTITGTLTATAFSGDGSALTNLSGGVSAVQTVVVTSSGTYTPTSGTKFVTVYCIGAGGGGGNTSGGSNVPCVGGGGGAGGMAIRTYNATELGANASVSIGSGGSGGASHHDPRDGSNGNGTTFDPAGTGTTLIGYGGTAGYGASNNHWGRGGVGGSASNGQINQNGMPAYVVSNHSADQGYSRSSQGNQAGVTGMMGGDSMFTRGSVNTAYGSSGNVEVSGAAGAIGCGGQGAMARQNYQAAGSGGSGGSGYVVIMEYA